MLQATQTASRANRHRLFLLLAHFLLTYPRWSWGLFLFFASRSLPLETIQQGLHNPVQRVRERIEQESQLYEECTLKFFSQTVPSKRNVTMQAEMDRVQRIRAINQQTIEALQQTVSWCQQIVTTAQHSIQTWAQVQSVRDSSILLPLVSEFGRCSNVRRQKLTEWLWGTSPSRQQVLTAL